MSDAARVLLVEHPDPALETERKLSDAGFEVATAAGAPGAIATLAAGEIDCVVTTYGGTDEDERPPAGSLTVLEAVREEHPDLPVVLFTDVHDEEVARQAIAAGVTDYIHRTSEAERYDRLVNRVENAVARRRAERRAERQARVTEVIRDINQALVRSDTRKEIEQSVCECLAKSEQYVLAWIAEVDDEEVSLRSMGVEGAAIEGRGAINISEETAYTEPVKEAARTREPVVVRDLEESAGVWEAALDRAPASLAAIPFVYEDRLYGVLVVYADRPDAFDPEEQRVLDEVGENIAYAMNAVAARRLIRLRERELRRQNERLDEFASVVSHDLRSPLTVARGNLELLAQKTDREEIAAVEDSLDRMETIIEEVLELARQGRTVGETEPIDVGVAARRAWANVETGAATLEVVGDPGPIEADDGRLVQLFENLFRNAMDHADADTVTVGPIDGNPGSDDPEAGEDVDEVAEQPRAGFFVEDDGPGLPEEHRDQVFESGYTTAEDGTGFGLAIVEEIAEAHGWRARIADREDGGVRFEFLDVEIERVEA